MALYSVESTDSPYNFFLAKSTRESKIRAVKLEKNPNN